MKRNLAIVGVLLMLLALAIGVASCGDNGDTSRGVPLYKGTFVAGSDDYFSGVLNAENMVLPSVAKVSVTYAVTTGVAFTAQAGEVFEIVDVYYEVTSNFNCTGDDCTLDLGDGGDADGYLNCADADLQTTYTDYTGAPAGWGGLDGTAPTGAYLVGGSNIVDGAETLDYALGGTSLVAGAADIYIVYRRIQ